MDPISAGDPALVKGLRSDGIDEGVIDSCFTEPSLQKLEP